MTAESIIAIIAAVLGSNLIQFFVTRADGKKGIKKQLEEIMLALDKGEKDQCRTQLLVMMSDYPGEKNEIMTLAEHYFKDLKGDWYLTELFGKWLLNNKLIRPEWYQGKEIQ